MEIVEQGKKKKIKFSKMMEKSGNNKEKILAYKNKKV